MDRDAVSKLVKILNDEIVPFSINTKASYEQLLDKIGDSRIVLMGEATHGTEEFYQSRIELSKYLITEKGFHAIAIEGDWTSACPVQRYLQGYTPDTDIISTLSEFKRFPEWMWRNTTIPPFLQWLRQYNDSLLDRKQKIGFYGLDLYCLNDSIAAVVEYLKAKDPNAAKKALDRYSCFDHFSDPQMYGYMIESKLKNSCIENVKEQLIEMQYAAFNKIKMYNFEEQELLFYALQNARVVKNAEHYYRAMFESRENTWNIRDQHMGETLQNLISHLETKLDKPAKVIIWAHNSHVGDARATEMGMRKEINLGQIVREKFSNTSFHLGFSTHSGTVTAASNWDSPAERKNINPGMDGSYEALFHMLNCNSFILFMHAGEHIKHFLNLSRLQRAIGVIYRPETERESHYFFTHLPYQFDALIHIDNTTALIPLK